MSKKDYVAIARTIADSVSQEDRHGSLGTVKEIADGLCLLFKRNNPRFDRDRFLRACTLIED
jgi:hypothetical protein